MLSKQALIIGASSGIGRYLAIQLGFKKYNIYALGKFKNKLEKLDDDFNSLSLPPPRLIKHDLTNINNTSILVKSLKQEIDKIDLIIFTAYHPMPLSPIEHISHLDFCSNINVSILSPMIILNGLKQSLLNSGKVVFLTCNTYLNKPNFYAYSAANSAVCSLAKTYSCENKVFGIKVGLFDPGIQKSGFNSSIYPNQDVDNHKLSFFPDFYGFLRTLKVGKCVENDKKI